MDEDPEGIVTTREMQGDQLILRIQRGDVVATRTLARVQSDSGLQDAAD